ncbi:MAG: hypothetical protein ABSB63_23175 [Spirochaetia bacterium]|jgi:hypothetical protein
MNSKPFFLSGTDAGMTPGKVTRLGSIEGLIAAALLLTLLFTGCVSTQLAMAAGMSQTPLPTLLPPDKKGSVRKIGVVSGGDPQFAMHAYEKDQQAEIARGTVFGGLSGFEVTMEGGILLLWATVEIFEHPSWSLPRSLSSVPALVFPAALVAGGLGGGVGFVLAAANSVPAKRAEEIEAAVLPALSDFPFHERMVEQILAAGTSNTEYSFLDLHCTAAPDHLSEEADTMLEVSVLNVGLRKVENSLQLTAVVHAQLIEKDTGTLLAEQTFSHAWRTFSRNKPEAGDMPLTREEIDGYLHVLSEDIVDTLCLMENFPTLFSAGVSGPPFFKYSEGLLPKNPKPEFDYHGFFGGLKCKSGTVDSLQPRLEWVPFPSQRNREMDTEGRLKEIAQVSYDLRIWRLAEEMHRPSELVYERNGLVDSWHTVEQPLEHAKTYYWAVRARFVRYGHAAVTQWTTCPRFLPLITKEGTTTGEGSFFSKLSGLYRFSTPAPPTESGPHLPGSAR